MSVIIFVAMSSAVVIFLYAAYLNWKAYHMWLEAYRKLIQDEYLPMRSDESAR